MLVNMVAFTFRKKKKENEIKKILYWTNYNSPLRGS